MSSGPAGGSLRSVGRSALILTGGTAAVQLVGIVRELFIAAQVGLSRDLDALLIALALPATLSGVLTSGLVTALVPAYLEARDTGGVEVARRFSGAVLTWVGVGGIALALALTALAGFAASLAGPGLDAAAHAAAVDYLRILAPIAFLAASGAILYSVCQAEERFSEIAIASFTGTAVTLLIMLAFWEPLHLGALAIGTVIGQVVYVGVLVAATIRASVRPLLGLRPPGIDLRAFLRHAAPLTASAAILQLNIVFDRAIASLLAPGAVSALRYAEVLVRTPISTISPAWGSAMYPALVRAARDETAGVGATTERALRYAIAAFVPLAALTAAVAPVAVAVAYGRGAFSAADIAQTARVVAGFAPLVVILMTSPVLAGAHNARRSGSILLAGGILNVILNSIFDIAFGATLGVAGIALSSSVTSTVVTVFFARRLASADPRFDVDAVARTLGLSVLAAAGPAAVIGILAWTGVVPSGLVPMIATLIVFGVAGLAVYVGMAGALGLEEPVEMTRIIGRGVSRARRLGGVAR